MVWLPSQIITLKKERVGARGGEAPEVGRAERAIGVVGGATPQRNNIISYIIPWTSVMIMGVFLYK